MVGNTSKNTDDAKKAYKKAKRQRRKLRKDEQLKRTGQPQVTSSSSSSSNIKWLRVGKEQAKKAVERELTEGYDVDQINKLLEQRTKAKSIKNYEVSDEITKTLIKLQIVYDDDKKEWHTREWKRGVEGGW